MTVTSDLPRIIEPEVHKESALVTVRMVADGLESYLLNDESAPPYRLEQWRKQLRDAERRLEKAR